MIEELDKAAETYAEDRLTLYPFPQSRKQYQLLVEIAFMQGAQWQTRQRMELLEARVREVRDELFQLQRDQDERSKVGEVVTIEEAVTNAH